MFSAPRAGSGAGDVGPESSPISHLSETMRALLDTSPVVAAQAAYFSRSEPQGCWWGELHREALGAREKLRPVWETGVAASLPFPSPPCPPLPFCKLFLIFGN